MHASESGELAVIAVMFEIGQENRSLQPLLNRLPLQKNVAVSLKERIDLSHLFPADRHYYRYSGSLTTPPCTEGLRWLVMKETVHLSAAQLHTMKKALAGSNNRPLQPLHGRLIVD